LALIAAYIFRTVYGLVMNCVTQLVVSIGLAYLVNSNILTIPSSLLQGGTANSTLGTMKSMVAGAVANVDTNTVYLVPPMYAPMYLIIVACLAIVYMSRSIVPSFLFGGYIKSKISKYSYWAVILLVVVPLLVHTFVIEQFNLYRYSLAEFDSYVFFLIGGSYANYTSVTIMTVLQIALYIVIWLVTSYIGSALDNFITKVVPVTVGTMCIAAAVNYSNVKHLLTFALVALWLKL